MTANPTHSDGTVRLADLRTLPPTIDVETAAGILGIGRTLAYQLAKADEFRVGSFGSAAATAYPPPT
ncbi:MAG TPA: hypothetical protein VMU51_27225 [Mycobacteriales bacterium]|nr:hypothetical protein [Mycobacteriales bacterium]